MVLNTLSSVFLSKPYTVVRLAAWTVSQIENSANFESRKSRSLVYKPGQVYCNGEKKPDCAQWCSNYYWWFKFVPVSQRYPHLHFNLSFVSVIINVNDFDLVEKPAHCTHRVKKMRSCSWSRLLLLHTLDLGKFTSVFWEPLDHMNAGLWVCCGLKTWKDFLLNTVLF